MFDAQTAMAPLELFDRTTLVGCGIVQENDERARQMTQQLAQEEADLFLPDVVVEKQVVKVQPVAARAE